jgi:emfourin
VRIELKQTGGFAGKEVALAALDTGSMRPEHAKELIQAVEQCKFFTLPEEIESGSVGADQLTYVIAVSSGTRSHSVAFLDEPTAPAALCRLKDRIVALGGGLARP